MTTMILAPQAVERLRAANPILKQGEWGDGVGRACFLAALEPEAEDLGFFVDRGWPWWIASLCVSLYDAEIGTAAEQDDANYWATRAAALLAGPVDYAMARDEFMCRVLARVADTDVSTVCSSLHSLIARRLRGEDVQRRLRALMPRIERMDGFAGLVALNVARGFASQAASDATICIASTGWGKPTGCIGALRQEMARQREDVLKALSAASG